MGYLEEILNVTECGEVVSSTEITNRVRATGYPMRSGKVSRAMKVASKYGYFELVEDSRTNGRNSPSVWRRLY